MSDDKTIRLWDVERGELLKTLRGQVGDGPDGKLYAAALSPDGHTLAVGGYCKNDKIRLFNIETGRQTALLKGHGNVITALAFSSDGRRLVSGSQDATVRIWNVEQSVISRGAVTALSVLEGHRNHVYGVAFSPNGDKMVSASLDHTLRLWQTDAGGRFDSASYILMKKHTKEARCVAWSRDGRYIVSGGFDNKILLWDADGNFIKLIAQHSGNVNTISFSRDGKKIVAAGAGSCNASVYAIPSGTKLSTFTKHDNTVLASAFFGTHTIATAGGNEKHIYIWNADTAEIKTQLKGKGKSLWAAAFGRGLHVAFGKSGTQNNASNYGPLEKSFDFSRMTLNREKPPATRFTRTRTTHLGKTLKKLNEFELQMEDGIIIKNERDTQRWIRCYTFTNDGNVVVGSNYSLKLYAADGTFLREFIGHTGEIWAVSISRDGNILASASGDQTLKLWNIHTGECLASLFVAQDNEWVCWTPKGYYAASANGEQYIGWHVNQGIDKAAQFYPVYSYRDSYKNPQLVKRTIELFSFDKALAEYNAAPRRQLTAPPAPAVMPPTLLWQQPVTYRCKTGTPSQRIRVQIDSTQKITQFKILNNGATAAPQSRITLLPQSTPTRKTIQYDVPLTPGLNSITVFAANSAASAQSDPRLVTYENPDALKPELYVVVIGISQYQEKKLNLDYARADAHAVGRAFEAQRGRLFRQVHVKPCLDHDATRHGIIAALEWLDRSVTQKDVGVVFVAAHGRMERGKYYLMPHDVDRNRLRSTAVSWDDVFVDILGNLPSRILVLLDACHSGAVDIAAIAKFRGDTIDNTEAIRELASREYGVVVMAATTAGEPARERKEWGHGAFTKALLEGLDLGKADSSRDGIIHLRELDTFVAHRVKELTGGKQHPVTARPPGISRFPIFQVRGGRD